MLDLSPEAFRKELDSLSQRMQSLNLEFQQHGVAFFEAHRAILDRIRQKRDRLATALSEAERNGVDRMKEEFLGAWNSFIADLELIDLQLQDADRAQERKV